MKLKIFLLFLTLPFLFSCLNSNSQGKSKKNVKKVKTKKTSEIDKEKVEKYLRKVLSIPSNIRMEFSEFEDAEILGMKKSSLKITNTQNNRSQNFDLYISSDGKYLFWGKVYNLQVDPFKEMKEKISIKDRPYWGDKNSKVVVVEFSDFQCPYCEKAHKMVKENLQPVYKDKILFVYKQFPLNFHNWAKDASVFSLCAYKQGNEYFWKMHDFFFDNQQNITKESFKQESLQYAEDIGLNKKEVKKCFEEKETLKEVEKDIAEGQIVEVSGTPTFFINGQKIVGVGSFQDFKDIIDEQLK
jgi:protein-disulfide isomerase